MIQQSTLLVMTPDRRILGTIALDSPLTFVGSETTQSVAGKTVPLQRVQYTRSPDGLAVDFMSTPISFAQERNREQWLLPVFADVSVNTTLDNWFMTGMTVVPPNRIQSALQKFLGSSAF